MIELLNPFVWALSLSLIPVLIYLYRFYSRKKYIFPTLKLVSESDSKKIKHNLTVSMGIGLYKPGISVEEFIELVDQKLYKAKLSGKDKIEAF